MFKWLKNENDTIPDIPKFTKVTFQSLKTKFYWNLFLFYRQKSKLRFKGNLEKLVLPRLCNFTSYLQQRVSEIILHTGCLVFSSLNCNRVNLNDNPCPGNTLLNNDCFLNEICPRSQVMLKSCKAVPMIILLLNTGRKW